MSGNASQRKGDRKSKEIPEEREEESGSGPVEKAGKRFHPDHTGKRKLGSGFGNAAGQLGTKAGSKRGLRQDVQFQPFRIDETQEVLLSDTVGFIRKLPTHLIEAFKATLEELSYADVLLHVIDISNPEWEAQARVVDGLISQLGASETPCLRVFNKCDAYIGILPHGDDIVCISARSGEGADALVSKLLEMLDRGKKQVRLEIPYSDAGIVDLLKREAAVLSMEYTDTGITAEAIVTPDVLGRVKKYIPGYVEPKEDWE